MLVSTLNSVKDSGVHYLSYTMYHDCFWMVLVHNSVLCLMLVSALISALLLLPWTMSQHSVSLFSTVLCIMIVSLLILNLLLTMWCQQKHEWSWAHFWTTHFVTLRNSYGFWRGTITLLDPTELCMKGLCQHQYTSWSTKSFKIQKYWYWEKLLQQLNNDNNDQSRWMGKAPAAT